MADKNTEVERNRVSSKKRLFDEEFEESDIESVTRRFGLITTPSKEKGEGAAECNNVNNVKRDLTPQSKASG
ncbi:hypothetical protein OS493_011991 [Desmophyllum pertusum]|uniref:Uncharacterized protein n=1 Tax=Desmophyllum pertusum TaxID=174260 RepID=A0A9X0A3D3_9CNID|nr:hypothetical protein OS493_011991 [Desmophyllum pertusum]